MNATSFGEHLLFILNSNNDQYYYNFTTFKIITHLFFNLAEVRAGGKPATVATTNKKTNKPKTEQTHF